METNQTIALMKQHASTRSYINKEIPHDLLLNIITAAQHGPTSINGQQISLVITQDPMHRKMIAEIAGGQPWIAQAPVFITVVADFYKTSLATKKNAVDQVIHSSTEGFSVGAIDAGITLANLITAARAVGLGAVAIGGIRRDPKAMIELLKLPKLTFPIVGLVLGYPEKAGQPKPRLPLTSFAHFETYHADTLSTDIDQYDDELIAHWKKIGRGDGETWSSSVTSYYKSIYFPLIAKIAKEQGFKFDL